LRAEHCRSPGASSAFDWWVEGAESPCLPTAEFGFCTLDCVHQRARFFERVRHGFSEVVDVLARGIASKGHLSVPVVGRGKSAQVPVVPREQKLAVGSREHVLSVQPGDSAGACLSFV